MGTPTQSPTTTNQKHILPSFDQVSIFFARPLSDAADSLGVCPSVLKKICYDNGLLRWPYRKVLSGKTIEEIKKDAAVEKDKQLAKSKASGEKNVALQSSAVPSSTSSLQESSQSRTITPQPGKDNQTQTLQNNFTSTMNKEISATSDEFKYGFPSDGLSTVENRWWGNKCEIQNSVDIENNTVETKQQDNGEKNNAETKQQDDSEKNSFDVLLVDEKMKVHKSNDKDGDYSEWTCSLSCMRKKAAKEAQNAQKLGVYRRYGAQTLNKAKRSVLVQIFKSSLPSEWTDDM